MGQPQATRPPDTDESTSTRLAAGARDGKFPAELVRFVPAEGGPVFTAGGKGHWDAAIRERGWIMKTGDTWRLWYTGYDGTREGLKMLGYATSADGIQWTRYPLNPIYRQHWVEDMMVVLHDGIFYMFAEGRDDLAHLLRSQDGIEWKRVGLLDVRKQDGSPISPGPYGTPTAWFEDGTWYLFYERADLGVWLATSTDMKVWTNLSDDPVLLPGPGKYDERMIALNQIIKHHGRYYAYYHGHGTGPPWGLWTTNVATSTDLRHWEKYEGNPLFPVGEDKSSGMVVHDGRQFRYYSVDERVILHWPANRGITGVTRRPSQLTLPQGMPSGVIGRYGLTIPFQISPTEAGLLANIRQPGAGIVDWEHGNDVIVFDSLDRIDSAKVFPLNRSEEELNPNTGKPVFMKRGPFLGGFVPWGAKRPDSSPHPHAGTGFAIALSNAYPVLEDYSKPFSALQGKEAYSYCDLYQLSYDGEALRVTDKLRLKTGETLMDGALNLGFGLRAALPDGDDLLRASGGKVVRWRRGEEGWRPVSYKEVTGGMPGSEDSLIRTADGSLLFSFRPQRIDTIDTPTFQAILVWRSKDNGETWEKIVDVKNLRNGGPVTLNRAVDGTPFVAANLTFQAFVKKGGEIGNCIRSSGYREVIMLWPLNQKRTGVVSPFVVRWPRYEFGPPPSGGSWAADHPTGAVVRLADGRWHSVLAYRVLEWGENGRTYPPTPWSGAYVDEVLSSGPPQPAWNF